MSYSTYGYCNEELELPCEHCEWIDDEKTIIGNGKDRAFRNYECSNLDIPYDSGYATVEICAECAKNGDVTVLGD